MNELRRRLSARNEPIRVAIVGAGSMGKGLFYQCGVTPGFDCVGIADLEIQRAVECAVMMGREWRLVQTVRELDDAVRQRAVGVCRDGGLLADSGAAEVFIEASSSIGPAARHSIRAVESGKHLVLMNSEIDLAFGPYLADLAHRNGVVYTSCDGDQHGVLKHLADDMALWGFELVMAGNIKGFLDRYANPTTIVPEADKRNLDYRMCTAYTDGTKLAVEMALLANALGLVAAVPGMHGPRARDVHEVFELLDVERLARGGPFVDYLLGARPDGGVFAIGRCDHPYQQAMMAYYKMGKGPHYLFYRPYHLCHVEALECVADAALGGRSLLEPAFGLRTNVFAYAKRPLAAGERLDGIGGYACYGMIENCPAPGAHPGLPICLADGVELVRPVEKDAPVRLEDVAYDPDAFEFELHRRSVAASAPAVAP